jgi:hypothetical protein
MEMHDLEFSGQGVIEDPDSGARERVDFWGPLKHAKILVRPEEQLDQSSSNLFPRLTITDVKLDAIESDVVVKLAGDLPLYKTHEFEVKIKRKLVTLTT